MEIIIGVVVGALLTWRWVIRCKEHRRISRDYLIYKIRNAIKEEYPGIDRICGEGVVRDFKHHTVYRSITDIASSFVDSIPSVEYRDMVKGNLYDRVLLTFSIVSDMRLPSMQFLKIGLSDIPTFTDRDFSISVMPSCYAGRDEIIKTLSNKTIVPLVGVEEFPFKDMVIPEAPILERRNNHWLLSGYRTTPLMFTTK